MFRLTFRLLECFFFEKFCDPYTFVRSFLRLYLLLVITNYFFSTIIRYGKPERTKFTFFLDFKENSHHQIIFFPLAVLRVKTFRSQIFLKIKAYSSLRNRFPVDVFRHDKYLSSETLVLGSDWYTQTSKDDRSSNKCLFAMRFASRLLGKPEVFVSSVMYTHTVVIRAEGLPRSVCFLIPRARILLDNGQTSSSQFSLCVETCQGDKRFILLFMLCLKVFSFVAAAVWWKYFLAVGLNRLNESN